MTTHRFHCHNCHQPFEVTESEAAAHGWIFSTVQHLACPVVPPAPRDIFDWSTATDSEIREMTRQTRGTENQSW